MGEKESNREIIYKLRNEIIMAEKINEDRLLPQAITAVQRYTGRFIPEIAYDWDVVINEVYPIIQYHLPSIFFRNPRVFLKPRNKMYIVKRRNPVTGKMEDIYLDSTKSAHTQEAILNYILSEIRYKEQVRKVLMDALLFKHGVLWHGYKGEFGMTEEQSIYIKSESVFVRRLSPMNFLFDPCVGISNLEEAKWVARSFDVPIEDLKHDETLNVSKDLKGDLGYQNKVDLGTNQSAGGIDKIFLGNRAKTILDYTDSDFKKSDYAKFVRCYEIFRRPSKKEAYEGKNGNIILLCKNQEEPLRIDSWPYKAEGYPAKPLVLNEVPDQIFGLSDLEVYGEIADQKNMVVNLQLRDAQQNSKVWVTFDKTGLDEEDILRIAKGQQTIVGYTGNVNGKMNVVSPGGAASAPLYTLDGRIQNNLDVASGVADLRKGILRSGEESAESVRIRNANSNARPAYRQDLMADFLRESCTYLNQLLKQFMPIKDAVRIVGSLDIEWSDNPSKEEVQADVDVEIDVISMSPENPEKEIAELTTILNLMFQAIENPSIFTKLAQEGKTFNLSPIIENLLLRLRIRDPEVFRNIKPEESQGFVSVAEVRAAKDNVNAVLSGQEPPSVPQDGQDHRARLEIYGEIAGVLQAAGQENTLSYKLLVNLIQLQDALLQAQMEKEGGPVNQKVNFGASSSFPAPVGV